MKAVLATLVLVAGLGPLAQPDSPPPSNFLTVSPATSATLRVSVSVDKGVYKVGERVRHTVKSSDEAYGYLFNVDASYRTHLIVPNGYPGGRELRLRRGETHIPAVDGTYHLEVGTPVGWEESLIVATRSPLTINEIARIESNAFATLSVSSPADLSNWLLKTLKPVPADRWTKATVQYRTRQ